MALAILRVVPEVVSLGWVLFRVLLTGEGFEESVPVPARWVVAGVLVVIVVAHPVVVALLEVPTFSPLNEAREGTVPGQGTRRMEVIFLPLATSSTSLSR